jgi:hypothetical protein
MRGSALRSERAGGGMRMPVCFAADKAVFFTFFLTNVSISTIGNRDLLFVWWQKAIRKEKGMRRETTDYSDYTEKLLEFPCAHSALKLL